MESLTERAEPTARCGRRAPPRWLVGCQLAFQVDFCTFLQVAPGELATEAARHARAAKTSLAGHRRPSHAAGMFTITEAEAAAIRTAFEQGGEFLAAVELRRLFPGVADNTVARECARIIAAWRPLQLPLVRQAMRRPR